MTYDDSNIFAKILRGEMPCSRIYEYDFVLSYANPTWADWGRLVDNYWGNLNGSDAANKVRETYSCEGSRMYAGTVIRNNN